MNMTKTELKSLRETLGKILETSNSIYKFTDQSEHKTVLNGLIKMLKKQIGDIDFDKFLGDDLPSEIKLADQVLRGRRS